MLRIFLGDRGVHDFIDLFPALEGQCNRHLRILARIDGFLLRELIKECLIDHHDLKVVADHDGYRILVLGELRVELESESGEERFRLFYVFYKCNYVSSSKLPVSHPSLN